MSKIDNERKSLYDLLFKEIGKTFVLDVAEYPDGHGFEIDFENPQDAEQMADAVAEWGTDRGYSVFQMEGHVGLTPLGW